MYGEQSSQLTDTNGRKLGHFVLESYKAYRENKSGDHTHEETHVPIPNTTVKLMRPMIVPNSVKVGHCRAFYNPPLRWRVIFFFEHKLREPDPVPSSEVCFSGL